MPVYYAFFSQNKQIILTKPLFCAILTCYCKMAKPYLIVLFDLAMTSECTLKIQLHSLVSNYRQPLSLATD